MGVFASAPWKKGSRGGGAEGKTKPASAVFFKRPPMASHVPLPCMTDGRVVQGAAEAWRGFLPLEHRWVKLSLGRGRDSLSSAVKISTNDLWLRGLRHKLEFQLEFSTTNVWIG